MYHDDYEPYFVLLLIKSRTLVLSINDKDNADNE